MDQIAYIPKTFYQIIYDTVTSQDFKQKTIMAISVSIELYRVMVSSLLLLFIPQECNSDMCTLSENMDEPERQYKIVFILNYITVGAFILMYITEILREEKLIKLLEVNPNISTDSESVGKRLEIFVDYKKVQLRTVVQHYQYASYFAGTVFVINTIFSWNVIYPRSLGNQTLLNFVTNILFMISKLSNVLTIIHTDHNIFFSAYLNTKVQFNDIDPREIVKVNRSSVNNQTEFILLNQAPVEIPVETPIETPIEIPIEAPIETPIETPIEIPIKIPIEIPIETPIEIPTLFK
jgi:hypothetical protein